MRSELPKIYAITDRELSGLSHTEQVRRFIEGGARFIQIREKGLTSRELFEDALAAVRLAANRGARVTINDRADIALATGAGGVHLGQNDLQATEARKLLGPETLIGVSTHTPDELRQALDEGVADYIAFGPIFTTTTKSDHEPVVGLETLRKIRDLAGDMPLVAIGGINERNLGETLASGADSVAMISEFFRDPARIGERFRYLNSLARKAVGRRGS